MAKPINVVIKGDYTDRDVNRAIRDLERLKTQSATTGGALGTFQKGMVAAGGALAAAFSFDAVINAMKDAAQAAMQDEKSMIALATAMDNVGLSAQNAQAEGLIESMMLQTGIADDRLRPAYQKLVTVTKDVTEAQGLLQTALDLSAAGYGDLESASKALSAAANGNFTALQRLKVPIDQAALASKDFDAAIASLNKTVGGQAAAAADTYAGQMSRITVAVGEAQEAIGYALLDAINSVITRMGGVGGLQDVIIKTGDDIALLIRGVDTLMGSFQDLIRPLETVLKLSGGFGGREGKSLVDWLKDVLSNMGPVGRTVSTLVTSLQVLGLQSDFAAETSRGLTSATVQAGIAAGKASGPISGMANGMDDLADSSANAADQVLKTVLATNALRLSREFEARAEMTAGEGPSLERLRFLNQMREEMDKVSTSARGAGSGIKQLTQAQQAAQDQAKQLTEDTNALYASLQGLLQEISPTVVSASSATFSSINAQLEAFKAALSEARSFAQGIVSGLMGQLDIGQALDDAKAAGTSIVEAFTKQGDKVVAFGEKMNTLLNKGLSRSAFDDILRLGYARGTDVANALADGNVDQNIANINKVYGSVKTMADRVAEAASQAFYQAGLSTTMTLIQAMIDNLGIGGKGRRKLDALMDDLARSMNRTATISVGMVTTGSVSTVSPGPSPVMPDSLAAAMAAYQGPTFTSPVDFLSFGMFAEGGIAMQPTVGVFGEAGPEALIPLDRAGDFGGSTYNITVNAGVGDPRAIGRSVVEAITLYERSSGPVFARA